MALIVCKLRALDFVLKCDQSLNSSFVPVWFRRIHNVLKGIPDDRDGLFDTIQRSKNHYQKRAYQCIKCMVALFSNCSVAYQILQVHLLTDGALSCCLMVYTLYTYAIKSI